MGEKLLLSFLLACVLLGYLANADDIAIANDLSSSGNWDGDATCSGNNVFYQFFFLGSSSDFADGVVKAGPVQFPTSQNYSICTSSISSVSLLLDLTQFPSGGEVYVLINSEFNAKYNNSDFDSATHVIAIPLGGSFLHAPSASPTSAPSVSPTYSCANSETRVEVELNGATSDIVWSIFSLLSDGSTQELFSNDGLVGGSYCIGEGEYAFDIVDIGDGNGIESGDYLLKKNGTSIRTGSSFNISETTRFEVSALDALVCQVGQITVDIHINPDSPSDAADISWRFGRLNSIATSQLTILASGSSSTRVCVNDVTDSFYVVAVTDSTGAGNADVSVEWDDVVVGTISSGFGSFAFTTLTQ